MKEKTCCFFGHRTINETDELRERLREIIEKLIVENSVESVDKTQFSPVFTRFFLLISYIHP